MIHFDAWDTEELYALVEALPHHGVLHTSPDACHLCDLKNKVETELIARRTCDAGIACEQGLA